MNVKYIIAVVLTAAALSGIFSTNPMAAYADESETNTQQELAQKNVGSGDSTNNNCGANAIQAGADVECFNEEIDLGVVVGFVDGRLVQYD